jgi:hypothetical protein
MFLFLQAFIFDGKTSELLGELDSGDGSAHKGGIYAVSITCT